MYAWKLRLTLNIAHHLVTECTLRIQQELNAAILHIMTFYRDRDLAIITYSIIALRIIVIGTVPLNVRVQLLTRCQ